MSQRTVISGCPTAVNTSSKLGTTGKCRNGWRPSTPVPAGRPRAPLRGLRPFRLRARRPRGRRRASSRWGRVRRSRHSSLSHHRLGLPFQYYSVLLTKSRPICSILPSNSDDFWLLQECVIVCTDRKRDEIHTCKNMSMTNKDPVACYSWYF